jgi:4-diphosphocytidyl-2-C-methyl-D-erythritol kinase
MLSGIQIRAPAKVNIGLKVLLPREDGFHTIESIFQTVSLYDDLLIQPVEENDCCIVHCDALELPAENTITMTYKAFNRLTGNHSGVTVRLDKKIPSGGGLGGGSSDAASFLIAFAGMTGVKLTDSLADEVAGAVGSDVFYFLHSSPERNGTGCAVVTGRGEKVSLIEPRSDLFYVLIFPEVHSATKEAYGLVDKAYAAGISVSCPEFDALEKLYRGPVADWTFANSFTDVLVQKYPVIGSALTDIRRSGALWADMSGSGATVFGIYDSSESAKNAFTVLRKSWTHCVYASCSA